MFRGKPGNPQVAGQRLQWPHGKLQLPYPDASLRPLDDRIRQAQRIRQISLDGFRLDVHLREAGNRFQQFFASRLGVGDPARAREQGRRNAQNGEENEIFQHTFQNSNPTVK